MSPELNNDILINGMKHRNRAIHGDVVAVELLPHGEWKGRSTALTKRQAGEKGEDAQSQPMPTGNNRNLRLHTVTMTTVTQGSHACHGNNVQNHTL